MWYYPEGDNTTKRPLYAIGQPVFVSWCYENPYRVLDRERVGTTFQYRLQRWDGTVIREFEEHIERMKPLGREKKFNGKIRTDRAYFYCVIGGLSYGR